MSKKKDLRPLSKKERKVIKSSFADIQNLIGGIREDLKKDKAPPPLPPWGEEVHVDEIIAPAKQARLVQAYLDLTDENLRPVSCIKNSLFEILYSLSIYCDIRGDNTLQNAVLDLYRFNDFLTEMERN